MDFHKGMHERCANITLTEKYEDELKTFEFEAFANINRKILTKVI